MRIFQTFVLPDHLVARHGLSFAAANFSRNLINGGVFDKTFSLIPTSVKGPLGEFDEDGYEVVYSRWRSRGKLLSRLAIFAEQWKIFSRVGPNDSIWFYNLNFLNAYLFLLLKIFKPSVRLNIIILDFTPAQSFREPNYWFLKLINRAHGVISLSTSELFKVKNAALLPGVVPSSSSTISEAPQIQKPTLTFLLSGVISKTIALTSRVLEAFAQNPQCILHITGKLSGNEDKIREYASRYPNIFYHGAIPFADYLELLHSVTFQLSTRDPQMPENRCNFPSKIIEALLHNRIVVSTIDYPQLKGINHIYFDADKMADALQRISSMPLADLMACANQSSEVRSRFSTDVWRDTMSRIEENEIQR